MNHEEIDQGKKRRAMCYSKLFPQNTNDQLIVAAAPDRVALYMNILQVSTATLTVATSPPGTPLSQVLNSAPKVFDLHVDQHGDAVRMAWYISLGATAVQIVIIEVFEEPCECN